MDHVSEVVLATVHPRLAGLVRSMAAELLAENVEIRVLQGLRTFAEQDADYGKVPRVTNARGGWSMHNFGLAVDCCPYKVAGQPWVPDWDGNDEHYAKMVAAGVSVGLVSGANWVSFKDKPHFQLGGLPVTPTDAMRADFAAMPITAFWALVDSGKYGR